jgi:hypothetical protein
VFTPLVRLTLAAFCLAMAALSWRASPGRAVLFLAAAALFALGYWRQGTVWLAWRAFVRGDHERMERRLAKVPRPPQLGSGQRAYYELLQGVIRLRRGDLEGARTHFTAAAAGRLRTENDRALVEAQLAEVALELGDASAARAHIASALALEPRAEIVTAVRALEARLPAAGT